MANNILVVAATRQSAADCNSESWRRSAETPLRINRVGQPLSMPVTHTVRVMGLIYDLDCPAATPASAPPARRRQRRRRIEDDTPILPWLVAWCVWDDAAIGLGQPLPRRWIRELAARANTVYAHNQRFRRMIRRPGDSGRDYLWMFMRHWLAALIHERRHHLFAELPIPLNHPQN